MVERSQHKTGTGSFSLNEIRKSLTTNKRFQRLSFNVSFTPAAVVDLRCGFRGRMSRDLGAVLSPVPEFAIRLQKAHDPQVQTGDVRKAPRDLNSRPAPERRPLPLEFAGARYGHVIANPAAIDRLR
jgi:hypothetical protein